MKKIIYIFLMFTFLMPVSVFSSELILPLHYKLGKSDLVVVGTVTSVILGEISKKKEGEMRTQLVSISLKIEDYIYGIANADITIHCRSVSFTEGDTEQWATAGFSSSDIKKGKKYIVYLKKINGQYYLSGSSNQYLEEIDEPKGTVSGITPGKVVPLKDKLDKLRKLAKEKIEKKKSPTK